MARVHSHTITVMYQGILLPMDIYTQFAVDTLCNWTLYAIQERDEALRLIECYQVNQDPNYLKRIRRAIKDMKKYIEITRKRLAYGRSVSPRTLGSTPLEELIF